MLAVDFVDIPSNRDARVLAARSLLPSGTVSPASAVWRARIAALEAEIALLDTKSRPPTLEGVHAALADAHALLFQLDLADAKALLADLNRR